ncbi:MAG: regulatory protein RecX [Candidatus Hydrothermia bacterium]
MIKDPKKYVNLLLKYRLRSEAEIRDRMKRKGFSDRDIEEAIEYLQRIGLLNEELLAEEIYEKYTEKGLALRKIKALLKRMGIKTDIVESFEKSEEVSQEVISKIIERISGGEKELDQKKFRKIVSKLSYLGYNYWEIKNYLEKLGYKLKFTGFIDQE